jgi:hypothetical protein
MRSKSLFREPPRKFGVPHLVPNKSLKYSDDGSLSIYLGNKSPGKEKESNWLPAPAGNFSIWLRAYWADQTILDGTWKPPVIKKIN